MAMSIPQEKNNLEIAGRGGETPPEITVPALPPRAGPILGLGVDLVASKRVRRMWERHGERFLNRCFTRGEAEYCLSRRDPVLDLAVRLAAKEACFKAIGGRRGMGLGWREFEVVLDSEGVPAVQLNGSAGERARRLGVRRIWLSLTHEDEWSAVVVIMTGGQTGGANRSE